jgi:hypothetical protein
LADFANQGGFGKFNHLRELVPLDRQTVIRMNRDTLYSAAVFDLDAGPVTISLPDTGNRYMSMQVIDEDHFTQAAMLKALRAAASAAQPLHRDVKVDQRHGANSAIAENAPEPVCRQMDAPIGLRRADVEALAAKVLSTYRVSEVAGVTLAQAVTALLRKMPDLQTIEL